MTTRFCFKKARQKMGKKRIKIKFRPADSETLPNNSPFPLGRYGKMDQIFNFSYIQANITAMLKKTQSTVNVLINDVLLPEIVKNMQKTYGCHTIILYGSRARQEATQQSDYDILAIRKSGIVKRDCRLFKRAYLDAFIYPEKMIKKPDLSLIRIKDGVVLCQKGKIGEQLLKKVTALFKKGVPTLPQTEKDAIIPWAWKMLDRAKRKDIEGDFRRHWLLYDLLMAYFQLRDRWYLGPKESFQWLKVNDVITYKAFQKALKPNASLVTLKKLIDRVAFYRANIF